MSSQLESRLKERGDRIKEKWLDRIFHSYPEETASFLSRNRNRFENPVGFAFRDEVDQLFLLSVSPPSEEELVKSLEKLREPKETKPKLARNLALDLGICVCVFQQLRMTISLRNTRKS